MFLRAPLWLSTGLTDRQTNGQTTTTPIAQPLLKYGRLKCDLLKCLKDISNSKPDAPVLTCVVLDRAAIVQMLKPTIAKTFQKYAQEIFIPYESAELHEMLRVDLVSYRYIPNSLEASASERRVKGVRRRVVATAAIPGKLAGFSQSAREQNRPLRVPFEFI